MDIKRFKLAAEKMLFVNFDTLAKKRVPPNVDLEEVLGEPDEENYRKKYVVSFENVPFVIQDKTISYYKKDEKTARLFVEQLKDKYQKKTKNERKEISNRVEIDPNKKDETEVTNESLELINNKDRLLEDILSGKIKLRGKNGTLG